MVIAEDIGGGRTIVVGETKYLHRADKENDYLIDDSENKVKVNLTFTKNKAKNDLAKRGVESFFRGLF